MSASLISASGISLSGERTPRFLASVVGKKVVMAVSGFLLFGFVLAHLLGNLQFFEGPAKMDAYARFLRIEPAILWAARLTLLAAVAAHIWSAVQLALRKQAARPIGYLKKKAVSSTYASRTMYWSGPIVGSFIVYHLLDFTLGVVNPGYQEGKVFQNVVHSFENPLIAGFYIFSMALLCTHLFHGAWSMLQTLGIGSPRYTPFLKTLAGGLSIVIFLGFISIPISVLLGFRG